MMATNLRTFEHLTLSQNYHSNHKLCISQANGFICITKQMIDYLKRQYSYGKKILPSDKVYWISDWNYLEKAVNDPTSSENKLILSFFGSSQSYRLRYQTHIDLAYSFIKKLINATYLFEEMPKSKRIESLRYDLENVGTLSKGFDTFFQETARYNPQSLYRLFDMYSSTSQGIFYDVNEKAIQALPLLALIFAISRGGLSPSIKSVGEFVARYEFFKAVHTALIKNIKSTGLTEPEAEEEAIQLIASDNGFESINDVWDKYCRASSDLISVRSRGLRNELQRKLNEEDKSITRWMRREIASFLQKEIDSIGFPSAESAAYHMCKHEERINHYSRIDSKTPEELKDSYKKMIEQILSKPESLVTIKPEQFDLSIGLVFEDIHLRIGNKGQVKPDPYRVFAKISESGTSFTLSCF